MERGVPNRASHVTRAPLSAAETSCRTASICAFVGASVACTRSRVSCVADPGSVPPKGSMVAAAGGSIAAVTARVAPTARRWRVVGRLRMWRSFQGAEPADGCGGQAGLVGVSNEPW
jgi:hypothetical protein